MLLNTQGPLYVSGLVLLGEYKYEIGEEKPDGKETDRRKRNDESIKRKIKNEYTYTYFWMQAQSI